MEIPWSDLARKHMGGRTSKQCRVRWFQRLDPSLVKAADMPFQPAEDSIILEQVKKVGRKWKHIARLLPRGRTSDSVRFRHRALVRMSRGLAGSDCAKPEEHESCTASNTIVRERSPAVIGMKRKRRLERQEARVYRDYAGAKNARVGHTESSTETDDSFDAVFGFEMLNFCDPSSACVADIDVDTSSADAYFIDGSATAVDAPNRLWSGAKSWSPDFWASLLEGAAERCDPAHWKGEQRLVNGRDRVWNGTRSNCEHNRNADVVQRYGTHQMPNAAEDGSSFMSVLFS